MAGKRSRNAFEADLQKKESPYVFYGTPLPPLDDNTRDDGSFVPVWKQEVTDDRGRKRLHGAFTGGFSAGYYNTVGSKEGWTPSTFVSSRQSRQKDSSTIAHRPEDFMDEEDLREAKEARNLATSDDFAGFGSTEQDPVRTASLMDILRPKGETIGSKLLKKMGWKEGQGIGPKVRRKANVGDGDAEEILLFAPENSALISFSRKTDHKGLGYEGESHLESTGPKVTADLSSTQNFDDPDQRPSASLLKGKRNAVRGTENRAFGVGILNDTGSDDEDPYEVGPRISYNKVTGAEKKSKKKRRDGAQTNTNPLSKIKPMFLSNKLLSSKTTGFRRSRDGRLPLDGFVLGDELDGFATISLQDDSMKPPVVPADWKPARVAARGVGSPAFVSATNAVRGSSLNAQARAALLGEKQLPGKSVFDFLSPAARTKLASASGKTDLPQAGNQPPPLGYEAGEEAKQKSLQDLVPQLDSQVALQALSRGIGGWMPYVEDESKRDRYRSFLEIRAGLFEGLPARAEGTTEDSWVDEMNEFARAAQVFKPVTGLMASRFTSSSAAPKSLQENDDNAIGDALLRKPAPKPDDPATAAAKMGMFGPITRSVINFYPSQLVCKRFNVQPPENAVDTGANFDLNGSSARQTRPSQFEAYQYEAEITGIPTLPTKNEAPEASVKGVNSMLADTERTEEVGVADPEKNEALEKERPGHDVFRAIFGSDDEDEDH